MRPVALIVLVPIFVTACSESASPGPTTVSGTNSAITGTVVERPDGTPYTYLRLKTKGEKVWVAVPIATVESGGKVTVKRGGAEEFRAAEIGQEVRQGGVRDDGAGVDDGA